MVFFVRRWRATSSHIGSPPASRAASETVCRCHFVGLVGLHRIALEGHIADAIADSRRRIAGIAHTSHAHHVATLLVIETAVLTATIIRRIATSANLPLRTGVGLK